MFIFHTSVRLNRSTATTLPKFFWDGPSKKTIPLMWVVLAQLGAILTWKHHHVSTVREDGSAYRISVVTTGLQLRRVVDPRVAMVNNVSCVTLTFPHAATGVTIDIDREQRSGAEWTFATSRGAVPRRTVAVVSSATLRQTPITVIRVHNILARVREGGGVTYATLNVSARITFPTTPPSRTSFQANSRIFTPTVHNRGWGGATDALTFPQLEVASSHMYYCNSRSPGTELYHVADCYLPGPCQVRCCAVNATTTSLSSLALYPNHEQSLGVCDVESSSPVESCPTAMPEPTCTAPKLLAPPHTTEGVVVHSVAFLEVALRFQQQMNHLRLTRIDVDALGVRRARFNNSLAYAVWDALKVEYDARIVMYIFLLGDVTTVPTLWYPDQLWFASMVHDGAVTKDIRRAADEHMVAHPCAHAVHHCTMGAGDARSFRASDNGYGMLDGNDAFLDAVVTRFPGRTSDEVESMVQRAQAYRTRTPKQQLHYRVAALLGSSEGGGVGFGGEDDAGFLDTFVRPLLEEEGYVTTLLEQGIDDESHVDRLASGQGLLMYTGHGTRRKLSAPHISTESMNVWVGARVASPLWMNVGCNVGEYFDDERSMERCLQEVIMTTGNAVVTLGSSKFQAWMPPMYAQYGMADGVREGVLVADLILHSFHYMNIMQDAHGAAETLFWNVAGDVSVHLHTPTRRPMATRDPRVVQDAYVSAGCCASPETCTPAIDITQEYDRACGSEDDRRRFRRFHNSNALRAMYDCSRSMDLFFQCEGTSVPPSPPNPPPPPTSPPTPSPPTPPFSPNAAPHPPPPTPPSPPQRIVISDVRCGGGEWDNEIGWTLTCRHPGANVVTHTGGAPDLQTVTTLAPSSCTLLMTDDFGDGWNGATWRGFGENVTMPSGLTETVSFYVP